MSRATTSRLFLALWPTSQVAADLASAVDQARHDSPDWLRWQPVDRWHLTMTFLGDTADTRIPKIAARTGPIAARANPKPLAFQGAGHFGPILWVGVHGGEWLAQQAALLHEVLLRGGTWRGFTPHMTLARARRGHHRPPRFEALDRYRGPAWTPRELVLVRSKTGPAPQYTTIESFPLGHGDAPGVRSG